MQLILVAGCAAGDILERPFGPDGRTMRQEIAAFPPEQRAAFALAERRCTACHTLNEPFSAHLPPGAWRSKVRQMARQPGAAIPSADQEKIAAFFEYFFERWSPAKK